MNVPRRLGVALVQGGPSSEAEVSRRSAAALADALREAGHAVVRLELDAYLSETLRSGAYDVAFPIVHGAVGEDGSLQGLFEILDLPYVGSGVLASAMAMSKRVARRIFEAEGLPVARGLAASRGDTRAIAEHARATIGPRLVVKPSSHGSAIGVARLEASSSIEDCARALDAVFAIDEVAIVEHFAKGREITCGVVHLADGPRALPPTEIVAEHDAFYTFEARYAPGRSRHQCPAPLESATLARVQEVAVAAHRALECRDLSRVDFVVGDDDDPERVHLLEVNTLPGMTATSLYPEAAAVAGLAFPALADALVRQAFARGPSQRTAPRAFPT